MNVIHAVIDAIFPPPQDEVLIRSHTPREIDGLISHAQYPFRGLAVSDQDQLHIHAVWNYQQPLARAVIWQVKYGGSRYAADCAGYALSEYIHQYILKHTAVEKRDTKNIVIIPIPLSKTRERERGYNQCEWIGQALVTYGNQHSFKLQTDILKRTEHRERQTKKHRSERIQNAQNIFEVSPHRVRPDILLDPDTIFIIIDDVVTTGSTLASAMNMLRKAGAIDVIAIAVAH